MSTTPDPRLFSPGDLSGLVAWWDAADAVTDEAGRVVSWPDRVRGRQLTDPREIEDYLAGWGADQAPDDPHIVGG